MPSEPELIRPRAAGAASPGANEAVTAAWEARLPPAEAREAALYRRLAALGIAWTTHTHRAVFTVEEARALRGAFPGTHTKNLFLEDKKGALWLVSAREDLAIDLNALAKTLGRPRFSFGSPELLVDALGIIPGAVSPFALMNDTKRRVSAVFDLGMLVHEPLNFHPLRNDRTTAIAAADLLSFAKTSGHEPLVIALPERQGGLRA
jgi:Ala-tRNA(Pro) deacylase